MTQDDFQTLTGQNVSALTASQWGLITSAAGERLASLLCLEELPEFTDKNRDLEALFAAFVAACIKFGGNGEEIDSKTVRSFSIKLSTDSARSIFAVVARNFSDVVEKYSACDSGIKVERGSRCHYCGGDDDRF